MSVYIFNPNNPASSAEILECSKNINVCQVGIGLEHFVFIDDLDQLMTYGSNKFGQLGNGNLEDSEEVKIIMKNVEFISCGSRHNAAVDKNGKLWLWGDNRLQQCGFDNDDDVIKKPKQILKDNRIISVSCSITHSSCVDDCGNLYVWGKAIDIGLKLNSMSFESPIIIDRSHFGNKDVIKVSCGYQHTLVLLRKETDKLSKSENISKRLLTESKSLPEKINEPYQHNCSNKSSRIRSASSVEFLDIQCNNETVQESDEGFPTRIQQILSVVPNRPRQMALDVYKTLRNSIDRSTMPQASTQLNLGVKKCCPMQKANSCSSINKYLDSNSNEDSQFFKSDGISVQTETWCWGKGNFGQLGQGDEVERNRPVRIRTLTDKCVIDIHAGVKNSIVLTADCTVFTFGFPDDIIPRKLSLSTPCSRVALSLNYSLMILDAPKFKTEIWLKSKNVNGLSRGSNEINLKPCKQIACSLENRNCLILCDSVDKPYVYELAVTERHLLNSLLTIHQKLLTSIVNSEAYGTFKEQSPDGSAFERLLVAFQEIIDRFRKFCIELNLISRGVVRLDQSRFIFDQTSFNEYGILYINCIALGSINNLSNICRKTIDEVGEKVGNILKTRIGATNILLFALSLPLRRAGEYARLISKIATTFPNNSFMKHFLCDAAEKWSNLKRHFSDEHRLAEVTRKFWLSSKLPDIIRKADRRVLKEGDKNDLMSSNAGRFFSRYFILFNDVLIDFGFATSASRKYNLNTVWLDLDLNNQKKFILITPEEHVEVVASTVNIAHEWVNAINSAIRKMLKVDSHHMSPPIIRTATYEFDKKKKSQFKGGTFNGQWLYGKMHGHGSMIWSDGRNLTGFWSNALPTGYCEEQVPDSSGNLLHYKGNFRSGTRHGFAEITYANGAVYEGRIGDGVRHGHGELKEDDMAFIGEFSQDKKDGYGVLDSGNERYLGNWKLDNRHGNGMLLTLDGRCICGIWKDDKIFGDCVILYENQACYTGQVNPITAEPNGKGILVLPSGYILDGQFQGSDIQGSFTYDTTIDGKGKKRIEDRIKYPPFHVSASKKWLAIWLELKEIFSIDDDLEPIPELSFQEKIDHVWQCVRQSAYAIPSNEIILTKNPLETTTGINNDYDGDKLTKENIDIISDYLNAIIDTNWHPLGIAMRRIVAAFRISYTGIGCHPEIMLALALSEVEECCRKFTQNVIPLFPILPENLDKESYILDDDQLLTATSLVHPLFIPRIYTTLFALFALVVNSDTDDERYWKKVVNCSKLQHRQLSAALGVAEHLKDVTCETSADCLQRLPTAFSIFIKLDVLQRTFQLISDEVKRVACKNLPMDDLLPLVELTVVKAKIRHLGAEILFMERLMEDHIQHGEKGILLTTLSAAYLQLQNEICH